MFFKNKKAAHSFDITKLHNPVVHQPLPFILNDKKDPLLTATDIITPR